MSIFILSMTASYTTWMTYEAFNDDDLKPARGVAVFGCSFCWATLLAVIGIKIGGAL